MARTAYQDSAVGRGEAPESGLPRDGAGAGNRLRRLVAPTAIPPLLGIGVLLVLGASEAGFYPTTWYPGALFLLALLVVSIAALRPPPRPAPLVLAAMALLASYTAWTYLSIAWAQAPADAWDGANRTAAYLIVFVMFAAWPLEVGTGRLALGLLGLGVAGLGLLELLRADASASPNDYFISARFSEPAGYINANAALWTLALWPCMFLASAREAPVVARGLALGGAGVLAALALMGQSRGWAFTVPVAALVFVLLSPGRVRALAAVLATAAGALAVSGPVLAVHDNFTPERLDVLLGRATDGILAMSAILAVLGIVAALADRRVELTGHQARRLALGVGAVVALVAAAGAIALVATKGRPGPDLADAWQDFKEGGSGPASGSTRFASSAGTNRYDFWTLAWKLFTEQPVRGIGVENFQQQYMQRGDSPEFPRYPHSLPLGVLSQTGAVGAALLFGAMLCAVAAAARSLRRSPRPSAAAIAAALALFAYWLAHGSVDWFWEFPGLAAPAFAALGMATALGRRRRAHAGPGRTGRRLPRRLGRVVAGAAALLLAASLILPWLAERNVERAAATWRVEPGEAFERLDRAAALNPLSPEPYLYAGVIAVRLADPGRAANELRAGLRRDRRNVFALLQLGALASERGDRDQAVALLEQAVDLSPRDEVASDALARARRGERVTTKTINSELLERARREVK